MARLLWPKGLSARLLILTALFVALAELLVLAPSLALFEERWLLDRVRAAETASLAVDSAPDRLISETRARELRETAGVVAINVDIQGVSELILGQGDIDVGQPYAIDLRNQGAAEWLTTPFRTLFAGKGRYVRVVALPTARAGRFIEVVTANDALKRDLIGHLLRVLGVTVFISAIAGGLVYLSLNYFLVRPMQRITLAMERFRANPEDPTAHIEPSGRRDEVGRAERELDQMQADLRTALASRARLAALGEAVAKINHDLRNMLTSAQIASERLSLSGDPKVAQAMPRLERALDHAIKLATGVLTYGRTEEAAPEPVQVRLKAAVQAAAEDAGLARAGVALKCPIKAADRVRADPDQLHRILLNVLKNARQAVQGGQRAQVQVSLARDGDWSVIRVADNGPGVPARARERLFQPFAGSARPGGTGLGLAIARELAQAHGGDLSLEETGPKGAVFELRLPAA